MGEGWLSLGLLRRVCYCKRIGLDECGKGLGDIPDVAIDNKDENAGAVLCRPGGHVHGLVNKVLNTVDHHRCLMSVDADDALDAQELLAMPVDQQREPCRKPRP